jgi:catechol 2,3-dioxygenase-like lactoylglutathione lyase family enzyme
MDYRIELLTLPVTDVDRARDFYVNRAGFELDHDHRVNERLRFVQLTPPGSGCSIAVGEGLVDSQPGSVKGLQMVVDDIEAAQAELSARGLEIGEIQDLDWGRFLFFSDPDGNAWAIQQIPPRP